MSGFDESILQYVRTRNLVGVRAGDRPRGFLDIWMVVVDGRIFARSWGLAERSWYTEFLSGRTGEIRCGDSVVKVAGVIPADLTSISEAISAEYLRKYDRGSNSQYARGIVQPEHVARTMEFVPLV